MRILIYTVEFRPMPGGMSQYSTDIAHELVKQGHDVEVITPHEPGDAVYDATTKLPITRINPRFLFRELSATHLIAKRLVKGQTDLVMTHMWYPCGIVPWFLSWVLRIRYTVTAHGVEVMDSTSTMVKRIKKLLRWVRISIFNRSICTYAVSNFTRDILVRDGVMASKVFFVPNGVYPKSFSPMDKGKAKRHLGLNPKRKVILTVSRLDDYKGHDMVIKSLPRLKELVKEPFSYAIVGDGPYRGALQNLTEDLGLDEEVLFKGFVKNEDLTHWYGAADAFIMASREITERPDVEGFGISFVEAQSTGVPTIGGNSGGIPDAVHDGKTGLLVDPLDPKDIADKLASLLNDTSFAKSLVRQAHQRIKRELTWPHVVREMLACIDKRLSLMKKN
ncbi:MAG: glycosyltransferase family 4 protein [archaeon]